jgi:exodeoxyribonuclease VII small subunit
MSDAPNDNLTFEQSLVELDRVVRDLEDGQLGLEEALTRYESGVGLLKRCYAQLRHAEQRILLLTGTDAEGRPLLQPFAHTATADTPRPPATAPARDSEKRRRKKDDDSEIRF